MDGWNKLRYLGHQVFKQPLPIQNKVVLILHESHIEYSCEHRKIVFEEDMLEEKLHFKKGFELYFAVGIINNEYPCSLYLTGWQHQTGRLNTWSLPELLGQSVPSSWAWEHLQTAVSKQKITWAGTLAAATDLYSAKRCIKDEEATLQNEKLLFASGQFFWYQKNRDSSPVPLVQTDRDWTNWLIFSFAAVIIFLKLIYPLFQRCYATGPVC